MNKDDINPVEEGASVAEQASQWWVTLHSEGVTAADRREFGEWVARSPERIAAWLETERLMRALKSNEVRWPQTPAATLIQDAKAFGAGVVALEAGERATRRRPPITENKAVPRTLHRAWLTGAGLAAVLVAAIATVWFTGRGHTQYRTALGEQHSVVLDDGSLVTLNTASRIDVILDKERRLIHLLEGEALFQVAPDKTRPFEVLAGTTTVRAVGTQFNIDRRPQRMTVTVIEGKVLVDKMPVGAAERVVVTAEHVSAPERIANLAPATAWTQRRLVFERRPLGEVAEEFNRYNRKHIEIENPQLRRQEVTGVFQANDPDSFVVFLSQLSGISIERTGDGAVKIF